MQNLSRKELKQQWYKYFKCEMPPNASYDFISRHIAWEIQAVKYGGLKHKSCKHINSLVKLLREGKDLTSNNDLIIKSGAKLTRQYKGKKHEVIAVDDAFVYENKTYKSLSSIAKDITGTSWNGKVFFGAKK